MSSSKDTFELVLEHARETALLESTMALLEWDEHTGIPVEAAEYRAKQVTLLSGYVHQRRTDPKLGGWLEELAASEIASDQESPIGANVRGMLRDYRRNKLLPEALVKKIAHAVSVGQHVWAESKHSDDFEKFRPYLQEIIELRREEAGLLKQSGRALYDGLLDQYEENARTEQITECFAELRDQLIPIVRFCADAKNMPSGKSLVGDFDIVAQRKFSRWVGEKIGFDYTRGRLDETEHPFCTTLGPHDHRILTKYYSDSFASGLFGVLHEAGHGMYEQGLPAEWFGTPAGYAASLGVHESQSRLWENLVGRSKSFWKWCLPHAQKQFPSLQGVSWVQLYADLNIVEPSLIRIEADEVTYNLHILIRFELEQDLIEGKLNAPELPDAWSQKYEDYLGLRPTNHANGVLQDVHWSAGLIGYFPTYTLGNIFSAQLFQAAKRDLGDLDEMFTKGEFTPLLRWLRDKVHHYGRCLEPTALIERATGSKISSQPLIDHLNGKVREVYS